MKWMFAILFCLFLSLPVKAYAQSSYVLPYPSEMPGSRFYQIQELVQNISKFWYFGSFGQFKYSLESSDRYLVEAKTLFEYQQYFLGRESLRKSNDHFLTLSSHLDEAKRRGKDTSGLITLFRSARLKHVGVLQKIEAEVPDTVNWQPEKEAPSVINLHNEILTAIDARNKEL